MTCRTITEAEARAIMADEEASLYPYQAVNAAGLEEIREFLLANHIHPERFEGTTKTTMDMLRAWAQKAEFQLGEGNPPSIELKNWDSIHGRAQEYTISPAGIEWQICG